MNPKIDDRSQDQAHQIEQHRDRPAANQIGEEA